MSILNLIKKHTLIITTSILLAAAPSIYSRDFIKSDPNIGDILNKGDNTIKYESIYDDEEAEIEKTIEDYLIDGRMLIAVFNMNPGGVTDNASLEISRILRKKLQGSTRFQIYDYEKLSALLIEEGYQLNNCNELRCAVEMGRRLNADKVVMGDVIIYNSSMFISISLVDVKTGLVEFSYLESIEYAHLVIFELEQPIVEGKETRAEPAIESLAGKLTAHLGGHVIYDKPAEIKKPSAPEISVPREIPDGLYFGYMVIMPGGSEFLKYYGNMHGGSLGWLYSINEYVSLNITAGYHYSGGELTATTASFNSYIAGVRFGYMLGGIVYPYVTLQGKGIWIRETGISSASNFFGYGAGACGGLAINFSGSLSFYAEYGMDFARVRDEDKTNISSSYISSGLMLRL